MVGRIVVFVILFCLISEAFILAGPTIIRDSRITDIAVKPTLGRGYTVVTNTFQSNCLDEITITDPSYDFQYKFESIDTSKAKHLKTAQSFGLSVPAGEIPDSVSASGKTPASKDTIEYKHHIYVEINMDIYYALVDEGQTKMGEFAALLLSNKDIPGFFSSCGSYYIRSLGRNAKFISIYTYSDKSSKKDTAFEANLKASITKFGAETSFGKESEMMQQASEKKLSIIARAYGLGKYEGASLISYDIETFKAAVKDAFISMQNPMTGKITTMEIVPWIENTDFQSQIKLDSETVDPDTGKTMLLKKKKQVLNQNAEYLAEIERTDRDMMDLYYKARICRQTIEVNWMQDSGDIHPDYAKAEIGNNKFPGEKISLNKLVKEHLSNEKIEEILKTEERFMYASGGAHDCITKMLDSGIFAKSYRDIEVCVKLRGKLSAVLSRTVEEYCMPELVKATIIQPSPESAPSSLS
ncbi:MAG: hypothetical protein GY786_03815 [Proteobacteria bacterium]|nr:hypothetical protein [Pseudomonadota bacterium]